MMSEHNGVRRYLERPRQPGGVYAAHYEPGVTRDDLLAVARRVDGDAAVVEVGELRIAVVRYVCADVALEYKIVEAGHFLVYSEMLDALYTIPPRSFLAQHTPA